MSKNKFKQYKIVPVNEKKGFWKTLGEMFSVGRTDEDSGLFGTGGSYNMYGANPSIDVSKPDYTLCKSIFYASEVKDASDGNNKGAKYLLGAGFGKPIVNTAAAFAFGEPPRISVTPEADKISEKESNTEFKVNDFMQKNHAKLFKFVRNSFRDGDSYLRIDGSDKIKVISAERVDKITDPVTGELLGYDIKSVSEEGKDSEKKTVAYREELRIKSPFRQVYKIVDDKATLMSQYTEVADEEDDDTKMLPIVHFANEQEEDMKYGVTDYQSSLIFMANYSVILENAIKNNIYNSHATPIFQGIENMKQFLALNFDLNDDGEYDLSWDSDKLIVGGKGFKAEVLEGVDSSPGAERLLKILFYLICQTSETPEFVMGTAVQSSKASVSEQLPVLVKKAQRKQTQMEDVFSEVIKLYVAVLIREGQNGLIDNSVQFEFNIKWSPIVNDDMQVNLKIVQLLSDLGAITKETAITLLNPNGIISDPEIEIALADEESKKAVDENPLAGIGGGRNPEAELEATQEMEKVNERIDNLDEKMSKTVEIIKEMKKDG